jgi:hypothetical protein
MTKIRAFVDVNRTGFGGGSVSWFRPR